MKIKTITVIGATGTMGANVAGLFASFGDAKVFCVGRDRDRVKNRIPVIIKSVKADAIAKNLIPEDFSVLEKCVSESDLVFESISEDLAIKKDIAERVSNSLRCNAISCTGTSGLSVTELAECYHAEHRGRFFGVHMFNPPYSMSLCELIATKYSDKVLMKALRHYLEKTLYRTVVEVVDSPAFLGNRIGFQFINEALQYAERYSDNGGIDYIDAILGPFTGRSMAPLETSDFVGLDVHKAIVNNIYDNTNDYARDTFVLPGYVEQLIDNNKLGRKTKAGLYQQHRYENGIRKMTVYDINTGVYRDVIPYVFPFAEKMKISIAEGDYKKAFYELINNHSMEADICLSFLLRYIIYAVYTSKEVGDTKDSADDVMATGFKWCPPIAMLNALSDVTDIRELIRVRLPRIADAVDTDSLLSDIGSSSYDYRPFFRSGRK